MTLKEALHSDQQWEIRFGKDGYRSAGQGSASANEYYGSASDKDHKDIEGHSFGGYDITIHDIKKNGEVNATVYVFQGQRTPTKQKRKQKLDTTPSQA